MRKLTATLYCIKRVATTSVWSMTSYAYSHLITSSLGRVSEFAARHPGHPDIEDDIELQALVAQEAAGAGMTGAAVAARPDVDSQSTPLLMVTPRAAARLSTAQQSSRQATPGSKRGSKSKAKRALNLSEAETTTANIPLSDGVKPLPPLIAQVARHGPLYERVSFHNQPQWRAANEPLWNAYRLASMIGQRSQLTPILLDILRLPQRVLPKLGRSGRAARRRATAATGHRLRTEAERIRARYNCPDPDPKDGQQTQMSSETMAHTTAQGGYERPKRVASIAAAEAIRRQAADTTDDDCDAESDVEVEQSKSATADSDDERDEPFLSLSGHNKRHSADPDSRAARKANYLVQCGLTRKAAQVLHSTTQVADLRTAAAQETMLRLHPRPSSNAALPVLPQGAPPSVLEDDVGVRRLLAQSDNGTSAGPSGWGRQHAGHTRAV